MIIKSFVQNSTGPEVIKLFSCSTQLSMKFSPHINVKMPTIVGILKVGSWGFEVTIILVLFFLTCWKALSTKK